MTYIETAPSQALIEVQASVEQLTAYQAAAAPLIWFETGRLRGWLHTTEQGAGYVCHVDDVAIGELRDDNERAIFLAMAIDRSTEGEARAEIQLTEAYGRLMGARSVAAALLRAAKLHINLTIGDMLNGVRVRIKRDEQSDVFQETETVMRQPISARLSSTSVMQLHPANGLRTPIDIPPQPVATKVRDVLQPERARNFPDHPLLRDTEPVRRIAHHPHPAIHELAARQNIATPIIMARLLETANERPNSMPELIQIVKETCGKHLPDETDYAAMVHDALMYIFARFPKQVHDYGHGGRTFVMWCNTNSIGRYTD